MDLKIKIITEFDDDIFVMFKDLIKCESDMGKYFNLTNAENVDAGIKDFFAGIFGREGNAIFKAIVYDKPVGFIVAGTMTRPPFHQHRVVGFIEDLYVKSKYRRHGIGRELVKRAEQFLLRKGVEDCTLFVIAPNDDANQAYLKMGYEVESLKLSKKLE